MAPHPQQAWAPAPQAQPGGWNAGQAPAAPPQQGWAPPPQPGGFGQAPQAQPGFGQAPQAQPGGFGQAAPPQGGWQAQPSPPQAGWQSAPNQGFGGGGFAAAAPAPRKVGFFDKMPCPHCGAPMSSSAGMGGTAGRMVGGLVGWLVVTALASEYYCPTHGQVSKDALPEDHRSMVTMRKIAMLGSAGALLVVVFGCLIFSAALRSM